MNIARLSLLSIAVCAFWSLGVIDAAESAELAVQQVEPTPLEDDANLSDVDFVGASLGWAVGDRGVIWHSRDGGRTWSLQPCPVEHALTSVCFLSDRVGWVVGGGTIPYARIGTGVVLHTADGGATWQALSTKLPRLYYVQFFDLQQGVVVGDASPDQPTGVFVTSDGGQTWEPIPGGRQIGWRTGRFLDPEIGVVAGPQGRIAIIGQGALYAPQVNSVGLQGLRDIELDNTGNGWLVGDGALVRRTINAGLVWGAPATPLPVALRDFVDFRTAAASGKHVWLAGCPGSVVWHSADAGQTWAKQFTGQQTPINRLLFTSESHGIAVGELGCILQTTDQGQTWQAVRGGGRHAALMSIVASAKRVSLPLLAHQSGELGYRSLVLLPARCDVGQPGLEELDLDARLRAAVAGAGGSTAEVGWQFPLERPEHQRELEALVADWNRHTEGRLSQVFLGRLVSRLRTWRPSVVVLDEPAIDDAVAKLILDAMLQAVRLAADATSFPEQHELAGLNPWQVQKVFLRQSDGSDAAVSIDPHHYLQRAAATVQTVAAAPQGILTGAVSRSTERESYRLVFDAQAADQSNLASVGDFFAGLVIAPNSAARRALAPIDEAAANAGRLLVQRQRNVQAYAQQYFDEPRHRTQVISHLRQIGDGLPGVQAALQLSQLADEYRQKAQPDLVEATLVELVAAYPDEPVTLEAMRWLFQLWSSVEPAWQRVRRQGASREELRPRLPAVGAAANEPDRFSQATSAFVNGDASLGPEATALLERRDSIQIDGDESWRTGTMRHWHSEAVRMAALIRGKSPELYQTPEIQFPLAALMRQRGVHRLADRLYRRFQQPGAGDAWDLTARVELWLINPLDDPPRPSVVCGRVTEPPLLDGLLSDACWEGAQELRLTATDNSPGAEAEYPFGILAYDDEHLYFAWTIPKSSEGASTQPQLAGRAHDADLRGHDRVTLTLDVDRDYTTFYTIHVDQRGWVAEECWADPAWNPEMYIHADGAGDRWRIEGAIPFRELVPAAPVPGTVWAVGLTRTIPGAHWQSWMQPTGPPGRPESLGLLRFQ